ncbi:unnamed protein product [Knipowitschia caucasica]
MGRIERVLPSTCFYSRQTLLELRERVLDNSPQDTLLLENIPQELIKSKRSRKPGRRGGVKNRLRRRFNRPPLPSIVFTNLRSLSNKVDTIRAYSRYCNEFREASLL